MTTSFDLDLAAPNPTILADGSRKYLPGDPSAGYDLAGTWYSALTDQMGSAHSYVSESGVQSAITRYDPYGAARPGSTIAAGIGYGGEWADATGLVNLRARAYDPSAGRFTSRDGFGGLVPAPQTANRYSYALNGPYRYNDPSGRFVNMAYSNAPFLVSLALSVTPGIGLAYMGLMAVTGYDPITGHHLTDLERGLAMLPLAGKVFSVLGRLGEGAADVSRLGKADEFASIGRAGSRETRLGMGAEAGAAGAESGAAATEELGIVYRRTDSLGGKPYIGQAKSDARYEARQREHDLAHPDAAFEYENIGQAPPGADLDRLDEYFIRNEGGPTNVSNPNGLLANRRHEMSDLRYMTAGGDPWKWLDAQ